MLHGPKAEEAASGGSIGARRRRRRNRAQRAKCEARRATARTERGGDVGGAASGSLTGIHDGFADADGKCGAFHELRNRGVQDILIAAVDNLRGFNEAIGAAFPRTEIQKCIVHQVRNSLSYVTYKDYKPIAAALRPIYQAPSEDAGLAALDRFEEVWGKQYPLVVRSSR